MPTYQYRCRTCDARFEVQQSFSDDSLTTCPTAASEHSPPACAAPGEGDVRKVFTAPSITFKGDGFYKTDSRAATGRTGNGSKDKAPAEAASESDGSGAKTAAEKTADGDKSPSGAKEPSRGDKAKGDRTPAGAASP
ncbi:MAG: FmdB family transcriptional regulator [Acidimicrobiia bacterium]|nr:FmdB family transcriptional regulator [Acidimicrobiia bacterium]